MTVEDTQRLSPQEMQRWSRIGVLAAFAMALGYLETFIPIPIPGVKLGLANIAVLIALAMDDIPGALCIGIVKVLAAGLLFGNPVTMGFSAAGTALALAVMAPLSRLVTLRLEMLSVAGAIAHEIGQLVAAMVLLGTPLVWYSAPLLLVAGCVTGLLCGIVATHTVPLLQAADSLPPKHHPLPKESHTLHERAIADTRLDGRIALVLFLLYCLAVLHAEQPNVLIAAVLAAAIACVVGHVQVRTLLLALRPLALILVITVIAQIASQPQGTVLAAPLGIAVTQEALELAGIMFLRLLAITAASIALMHLVSTQQLVTATSWLLRPLRHLGIHTEGFALALQTALQTVPVLADALTSQAPNLKGQLFTRTFWYTTMPTAISHCYQSITPPSKDQAPNFK